MGHTRYLKLELVAAVVIMLAAALACGLPGQPSHTPAGQALTVVGEATKDPTMSVSEETPNTEQPPTKAPQTAEPVALNTCDLLTSDEVQGALGEAASGTYDPHFAACHYTASSGQQLIVTAYQGKIARDRTNEGMLLALEYFGNTTAQQLYDDIEPQLEDMTMAEMAAAFSTVEEALGREVVLHPELGDASYLVWIDGGSAQLGVVRGETVTSVATIGIDQEKAESIVMSLTETVWTRLPGYFTPAP